MSATTKSSISTGNKNDDPHSCVSHIFIGNLTKDLNESTVYDYCSTYGSISKFQIMKDPVTKQNRRFGFVSFESVKSTNCFLNTIPHYIGSRQIVVKQIDGKQHKKHTEITEKIQTKRIFVYCNGERSTIETLIESAILEHFSQFGIVKGTTHKYQLLDSSEANKLSNTTSNKYWITEFLDSDSVECCMSHTIHIINGIKIHVKRIFSSEEIIRRKRHFQTTSAEKEQSSDNNNKHIIIDKIAKDGNGSENLIFDDTVPEVVKEYVAAPMVFSRANNILRDYGYKSTSDSNQST